MRGLLLCCVLAGCGLTLDLTPPRDGGGGPLDGATDVGLIDGGLDAIPPDATMCTTDEDCLGIPRAEPPTTCGDFRCDPRGFCLANDLDGDGVGPGCEQPDCDDTRPDIGSNATIPCEAAPAGICGAEAVLRCTDGAWARSCEGIRTSRPEDCNSLDDDCDGMTDEDLTRSTPTAPLCTSGYECIGGSWVVSTPTSFVEDCTNGIDDDCDGFTDTEDPECAPCLVVSRTSTPVTTHDNLASALAAPIMSAAGRVICLLADNEGAACRRTFFPLGVDVPDGTTIRGNLQYRADGTIAPCASQHQTVIFPADGRPTTVVAGGNFAMHDVAVTPPSGDAGFERVVGVEVRDSTVLLTNVTVGPVEPDMPAESVGIEVDPGGTLIGIKTTVARHGDTSTGIASFGGNVFLAGLCRGDECTCGSDPTGTATGIAGAGSEGHAIDVVGGALVMEGYAACGFDGAPALHANATSTFVTGSLIETRRATDLDAMEVECSADEAVWVYDNRIRNVNVASGSLAGLWVRGPCTPLIASNTIHGALGGVADDVAGAICENTSCLLSNNVVVGAELNGSANRVTGLACEGSARNCLLLSKNRVLGASMGDSSEATGVYFDGGPPSYLESNEIVGGCGLDVTEGLAVEDASIIARGNEVVGVLCDRSRGSNYGLAANNSTLSWVGNTAHGGAVSGGGGDACVAYGAFINGPAGTYRNSLFVGGTGCESRIGADIDGRALIFVHNGFTFADLALQFGSDGYNDPLSLLADHPLFINNVFELTMPSFTSYPSPLTISGRPFGGAGAAPGGPDFNGNPRPDPPSIGAHEP